MDEHLVGYLLNALDSETHEQVEVWLEANPEGRERLERLRLALSPLEADRDTIEPPEGLAVRTVAHVAEYLCRDLPPAPSSPARLDPILPFWRRADALVAACLLLTVLGLLLPFVLHSRARAEVVACQNTLREVYAGLKTYSDKNQQRFPTARDATEPPKDVAGLILPMLIAAGCLPPGFKVGCPAHGEDPCPKPLKYILALDEPKFDKEAARFTPCYAYSLGYKDKDGALHGPRFKPEPVNSLLPIMADKPAHAELLGNSSNHGDKGQNVLYQDGHVKFKTRRSAGVEGDDIYLNKERDVKAGLDNLDTVLGSSHRRP